MKISIVGANSYIARSFIYYLRNVRTEEMPQLCLYDFTPQHVDGEDGYEQINILDPQSVEKIDFTADIIYIFAGKTGTSQGFEDYATYVNVNEMALLNMLTAYRKQSENSTCGKIVFPSSRLVYKGNGWNEDGTLAAAGHLSVPLKEDDPKEAKTVYAANKIACELYLDMYKNMYDVKYAVVRICVPYGTMIPGASSYGTAEFMLGKGQKGEAITLYGGGSVRRTLTHMSDLVESLYLAGVCDDVEGGAYNIGGEDYSLKEMAEQIATIYNVPVTDVPWPDAALRIESGDTVFDGSKLAKATGKTQFRQFTQWVKEESR